MGRLPFQGTVTLAKAAEGKVVAVAWRPKNRRTRNDLQFIPYKLAEWLQLVPLSRHGFAGYSRVLHAFTHEEFDKLQPDLSLGIQRVWRKTDGMTMILTVNLE